jgi:hypothetical protein
MQERRRFLRRPLTLRLNRQAQSPAQLRALKLGRAHAPASVAHTEADGGSAGAFVAGSSVTPTQFRARTMSASRSATKIANMTVNSLPLALLRRFALAGKRQANARARARLKSW